MKANTIVRSTGCWLGIGGGVAAFSYAALAAYAWTRYGHVSSKSDEGGRNGLLNRFMPAYDVVERHQVKVAAPVEATFVAATDMDLQRSLLVRTIFRTRELFMRGHSTSPAVAGSFIAQMRAIGWGVLAEMPGREIVMGAITQPWKADVTFVPLDPLEFAGFREPGYVKIVWNLRVDPEGADATIFRTETRAVATDDDARARFRNYWAFVSPGVWLIRRISLGLVKSDAEKRARHQVAVQPLEEEG
jgi:hypothetical protein